MPTVFHSAKCLCCMRSQSTVAERLKDAKDATRRDAKEAMASGMACIKAERKRKREAEYETMRAVRRGGPSGVVRRLSMNQ